MNPFESLLRFLEDPDCWTVNLTRLSVPAPFSSLLASFRLMQKHKHNDGDMDRNTYLTYFVFVSCLQRDASYKTVWNV